MIPKKGAVTDTIIEMVMNLADKIGPEFGAFVRDIFNEKESDDT